MKKINVLTLLLVSLSLFTTAAEAQRTADTPVTVTIEGFSANSLPPYRIQSDQLGVYKNSRNMESIIQGIGDWELDMLNFTGSGRTILVDLREPVPNSAPGGANPIAPFQPQLVRGRFIAKCTQFGSNFFTMSLGEPTPCPLAVAFDQGGRRYRLAFNGENFPNIDPVKVTCTSVNSSTSKCNEWKIEGGVLQDDGTMKSRAKLIRVASSKRETDLDMGNFYMSLSITITNP